MGAIKFPHTSGNSMSIAAPATNPASDLTLTLPTTIGSADQYMKVDGSGNLGWVTPPTIPAGGKILKVQHASTTSTVNHPSNSSAYVDTGLTMDFTATADTSTLIILVAQNAAEFRSAGGAGWAVQLHRDSSSLISEDRALTGYKELSGYAFLQHSMSAGDTSSHTFKTKTANHHSDSSGSAQYSGSPSTMTIWEISA